jgi:hypothetical protein
MPDDAFAPPLAEDQPVRTPASGAVLLAWMMSGGAMGVAVGLTAQLLGTATALAMPAGLACIATMTIGGLVALGVERRLSRNRPAVLARSGRHERPLHAALYAVPLALAIPPMLVLVVVGSVATSSLVPAMVFGIGGFGLGWAARRLASSHTLTSALEALEIGDVRRAHDLLTRLEAGWISTRSGRVTARLNLGMLALSQGELEKAALYYEGIDSGPGRTFALAGLALVRVLQDRLEEAEHAMHAAMEGSAVHLVQGQLDTVRLLLLMRTEDDATARHTGEQLLTAESGELFLGLLGLLRLRSGDTPGARALVHHHTRDALATSGWSDVIPEIDELLREPALL